MMNRVDFAIAGNQFLKSEALPYNPNVEVIPTSIDLSHYFVKKAFRQGGPITVGWLGSSSTLKYLKELMPTLENLRQANPNFQLKIVCDQFLDSQQIPVVKKKWSAEEEEADLESFDIGVMPLADDLWSRGKCGLKIVQYYGVGVPVVCTPIGVNRDLVEDGGSGFWAETEDEWIRSILKLMQDDGLRREMGLKGRERVERGYSLEVNAPRLLGVLRKVLS
jgi:glycosyltransferase involved in cell wall biosynthesis